MNKSYVLLCSLFAGLLLFAFFSAAEERSISIESVGKTEEISGEFEELHSYFKITLKKNVPKIEGRIKIVIYFFEIPNTLEGKELENKNIVLAARQDLTPFLPWDKNDRLFISTSFYPAIGAGFVFYGYLIRVYVGESLVDEIFEPQHLKSKDVLQNKAFI